MSIAAIFWDIGGVLVRTEDWEPRTKLAQSRGFTRQDLESLVWGGEMGMRAQMGAISAEELWEHVRGVLRISAKNIKEFRRSFFAGDVVDYNLVDEIRALKVRYRTGVISNAWRETHQEIRTTWQMADAFDSVTLSCDVGAMKPDPRIYHKALQSLRVSPKQAVFIDDFAENVAAAEAVGMAAIQFRTSQQTLSELTALLRSREKSSP